jgi:arylsulfatase
MEGVSLVPALSGKTFSRANPLFWEHEGNRAVRVGEWKLVSKHSGAWELYNMSADRTEMNDVALQHPERLVEMEAQWNEWAARVGVVPWPLGAGTPRKNAAKTNGR